MDPFLGEIRLFPWNFAPRGWLSCNGAILSITQNTALFALLGTMYGGNGQTTFAVPDLRGRTPVHRGQDHVQGEQDGVESVTLTINAIPAHTHALMGTTLAGNEKPPDNQLATASKSNFFYGPGQQPAGQPHADQSERDRRRSGAQEHAAFPRAGLLHRNLRHFPIARLVAPIRRR